MIFLKIDVVDRIFVLTEVFNLLFALSLKQENTTDLKNFLHKPLFDSIFGTKSDFGEEMVFVLISICKDFYDRLFTKSIPSIVVIIQRLFTCIVEWMDLDSFIHVQCMSLIDSISTTHNEQMQPVIDYFQQPERLTKIADQDKLVFLLLIIVKHTKRADFLNRIISIIQAKFQFSTGNFSNAAVTAAHKDGYLGVRIFK